MAFLSLAWHSVLKGNIEAISILVERFDILQEEVGFNIGSPTRKKTRGGLIMAFALVFIILSAIFLTIGLLTFD